MGIAGSSQLDIWTTPFYPIAGYIAAMSFRTLAASGALLIALAVPAAAEAATIDAAREGLLRDGRDPREPAGRRGQARRQRLHAELARRPRDRRRGLRGRRCRPTPTAAIGALSPLVIAAPFIKTGSGDFTVSLTEQGNPANTASVVGRHTALGVKVKPKRAKPSKKIRFKGAGFTQDKPVYAHYVFNGKLKQDREDVGQPERLRRVEEARAADPRERPVDRASGPSSSTSSRSTRTRRAETFDSVFVQLRISVTRVFG